jgi:hypothetical protein
MRVLFSRRLIAISKPRCGSTSLRRLLDPLIDRAQGDIAVDMAGQQPPFHPHLTAPYLRELLAERGHDWASFASIVVIRHPVEMLWSYWKFFRPDGRSNYSFSPNHDATERMPFDDWVQTGRVGMNPAWQRLAPAWISTRNLSPLSLEAHAMDADGRRIVDHVFRLEELGALEAWLAERLGRAARVPHVNASERGERPEVTAETLAAVRRMFPEESRLYGI